MNFFDPFGNVISWFTRSVKGGYRFGTSLVDGIAQFNNYHGDREKINMVLSNPAAMKVFSLQCDLFSMGRVTVTPEDSDEEIEDDPFLDLLRDPNPFTGTESQFLWDFMFWNMMGTSYCYVGSKDVTSPGNKMYFLDPSRIEWPQEFQNDVDKLIFSDATIKSLGKKIIKYKYKDGSYFEFPFNRLIISHDLTNSVGNFFKGPSRLDALTKIISNSEHTLDADNINIRYSGKFLVGSDKAIGQSIKVGMSTEEKDDIIAKIDHNGKNVFPLQSMVKIQRFVSDMAALQLDQKYLHLYFVIGNMYGIPRDVLEAYNSATYENQENARAAHVNYTLEPKGEQFMDGFETYFGYREQKKKIDINWDHLPFVQVFAKEKAETQKLTIENLTSLLALGVTIEDANKFLGTDFEIEEPDEVPQGQPPAGTGQDAGTEAESGQGETGIPTEPKGKEPIAKRNGQKVNGFHLQVSDD